MRNIINIFTFIILVALIVLGCKTKQAIVPTYHFVDSTKMIYQRDSIIQHDSVFVNQYIKGDTVYKAVYKVCTLYKDRLRRDTVAVATRDTITVTRLVEKPLSTSEKFRLRYFGILCIIALLLCLWTFRKPIANCIRSACGK